MAEQSAETTSHIEHLGVIESIVGDGQLLEIIVQESPEEKQKAFVDVAIDASAVQDVDSKTPESDEMEAKEKDTKEDEPSTDNLQDDDESKKDEQQLVFKCIPMSSDGKPDRTKTLKLNRDILKEVLEKHGLSMDPSQWPEDALEVDVMKDSEEKIRKQKKKAKKMKRKKERQEKANELKEQLQCKHCKMQFYDIGHLKVHTKVHLDENDEPLQCTLCNMMFKREIGLRYHMLKTHNKDDDKCKTIKEETDEGTFGCEEDGCTKSFKTSKGRTLHVNQIHRGIGKIKSLKSFKDQIGALKCEKCDKTFHKPSKLSMHMVTHSDLNLKCTECGTVCKSHNLLRRHYAQVHQDVKPCSQCGKRLKQARIAPHRLQPEAVPDAVKAQSDKICYKCYAKANSARREQRDGDLIEDEEEREEFLKCPICTLIYYGIRGLRNHMKRTHPEENTEKDDDYEATGDYPCEEEGCTRVFTTKRGLGLHMVAQHIKDARYTCTKEGCERAFITKSGLSSHIKRHEMPIVYECDKCFKKYDANYKLTEHKKSHKDPLLECQKCDKKFRKQGLLCQHELAHTGTVFTCPDCGKQFKRAEYVRRHQLQVHDDDPTRASRRLKRKMCSVCNHGCTTNAELRDHMNSHTGDKPHLCEFCPKTFACKASLFVHRQAHKEAYRCKYCNKVFGDKTRMKEHEVVHTGEKPFVCQQCGRRFGHRSNLREHLKRVHKKGQDGAVVSKKKATPSEKSVTYKVERDQEEPQQIYEIMTTADGHTQIGERSTDIIPIRLEAQDTPEGEATTIQVYQQQLGSGEIQLQEIKDGTTYVRTIQLQDGRIELQNPEQALAAEIVLQLHSDPSFTIQ